MPLSWHLEVAGNRLHSLSCRRITSTCLHPHMAVFLLCVSLSKLPSSQDTVIGLGSTLLQYRPHLNLIKSAKTPFPNKITFTGLGVWK